MTHKPASRNRPSDLYVWRQAEPYRHSWRDHVRDALSIIGQATFLLAIFAAIVYALPVIFEAAR